MEPVNHNIVKILEEKIAWCREQLAFVERFENPDGPTTMKLRTVLILYKLMLQIEDAVQEFTA